MKTPRCGSSPGIMIDGLVPTRPVDVIQTRRAQKEPSLIVPHSNVFALDVRRLLLISALKIESRTLKAGKIRDFRSL